MPRHKKKCRDKAKKKKKNRDKAKKCRDKANNKAKMLMSRLKNANVVKQKKNVMTKQIYVMIEPTTKPEC